jgi:hypothetical protein
MGEVMVLLCYRKAKSGDQKAKHQRSADMCYPTAHQSKKMEVPIDKIHGASISSLLISTFILIRNLDLILDGKPNHVFSSPL